MSTNGKWRGKDGQWYDTLVEKSTADVAWDEKMGLQEEQNRLLRHQNQLLEQQNQLNYQLEQEKIQKNYELEMNKMQHEEKMRLYKLFDNIGISKEIYDAYINTNYLKHHLSEKAKELYEYINIYNFILNKELCDKNDILEFAEENDKIYDICEELYEKFIITDFEKYDSIKEEITKKQINKKKKRKYGILCFIISLIIICTSIIFDFNNINNDFLIFILVMIMLSMPIFGILLLLLGLSKQDINLLEKELSLCKKINMPEYNKEIKKRLKKLTDEINKEQQVLLSKIQPNLKEFYNFRIEHYNSNIEKLLVDVGFKELIERLGLEYMKVNNGNKKKEGTIEDYIEYFESHS